MHKRRKQLNWAIKATQELHVRSYENEINTALFCLPRGVWLGEKPRHHCRRCHVTCQRQTWGFSLSPELPHIRAGALRRVSNFRPRFALPTDLVAKRLSIRARLDIASSWSHTFEVAAMGVLGSIFKYSAFTGLAGGAGVVWAGRHSKVFPLPTTDYLFNTTWYARVGPD